MEMGKGLGKTLGKLGKQFGKDMKSLGKNKSLSPVSSSRIGIVPRVGKGRRCRKKVF